MRRPNSNYHLMVYTEGQKCSASAPKALVSIQMAREKSQRYIHEYFIVGGVCI